MRFTRLILGLLLLGAAFAQQPVYQASDIVNAADFTSGPFAPNSVLSVFGSNLSWDTHALTWSDIKANTLPTQMANVEVYVDNWAAPLLYVSPTQINFLVPGNEIGGNAGIRVSRQGVFGSTVTVALVEAAPALFDGGGGYAIATHGDGSLLTAGSPGQPGEIVVVYATGLGATQPNPLPGEIPQSAAPLLSPGSLSVSLDGVVLPASRIKYAGATPQSGGLYQINLEIPPDTAPDPAIRIAMGTQSDSDGLRLAIQ